MDKINSILFALDGVFRFSLFAVTSVMMTLSLTATIHTFQAADEDGFHRFQRVLELIACYALANIYIAPYLPTDTEVRWGDTFLGITRLPQSVVAGALSMMVAGIRSRQVNLSFVNGLIDGFREDVHIDITNVVVDAHIITFIAGWAFFAFAAWFHSSYHTEKPVDRNGSIEDRVVRWKVRRYYDSLNPRTLGILDYLFAFLYSVCIMVFIAFRGMIFYDTGDNFSLDVDRILNNPEVRNVTALYYSYDQMIITNTANMILLVAILTASLTRLLRGINYVIHSAELLTIAYITVMTINDFRILNNLREFGILNMQLDTLEITLILTLIWVAPLFVNTIQNWDIPLRVTRNSVDFFRFVYTNGININKYSRSVFPLAVMLSFVGTALMIGGIQYKWITVDYKPAPLINEFKNVVLDADHFVGNVIDETLEVVTKLNPCVSTHKSYNYPSKPGTHPSPTDNNNGVQAKLNQLGNSGFSYTECCLEQSGGNYHFRAENAITETGVCKKNTCIQYRDSITHHNQQYHEYDNKQDDFHEKRQQLAADPTYYDESCFVTLCEITLGVIESLLALELIPFVSDFIEPVRLGANAARLVFKEGLALAKSVKWIVKKRQFVEELAEIIGKVATKTFNLGIDATENVYYAVLPIGVLLIFGIGIGFWKRKVIPNTLLSATFFILFVIIVAANVFMYFILTSMPPLIEDALNTILSGFMRFEIIQGTGWKMFEAAYFISFVDAGLFAIVVLLNIIASGSNSVIRTKNFIAYSRGPPNGKGPKYASILSRETDIEPKKSVPIKSAQPEQPEKKPRVSQGIKKFGSLVENVSGHQATFGDYFSAFIVSLIGLSFGIVVLSQDMTIFKFTAVPTAEGLRLESAVQHSSLLHTESETIKHSNIHDKNINGQVCAVIEEMMHEVVDFLEDGLWFLGKEMAQAFKGILGFGEEFLKHIQFVTAAERVAENILEFAKMYIMQLLLVIPPILVNLGLFVASMMMLSPKQKKNAKVIRNSLPSLLMVSFIILVTSYGILSMFSGLKTPLFETKLQLSTGFTYVIVHNVANVVAVILLFFNSIYSLEDRYVPPYLNPRTFKTD